MKPTRPDLLLRIGKTEDIERVYNSKKITFGCAANWIDYANTAQNSTIGDSLEAVFAREKFPCDISKIKDRNGLSLQKQIHINHKNNNPYCFLHYKPVLAVPVLCFYSLNVQKLFSAYNISKKKRVFGFLT